MSANVGMSCSRLSWANGHSTGRSNEPWSSIRSSRRHSSAHSSRRNLTISALTNSLSGRGGGWLMLDLTALQHFVEGLEYAPLFVTVSGAHLYGFPSPD